MCVTCESHAQKWDGNNISDTQLTRKQSSSFQDLQNELTLFTSLFWSIVCTGRQRWPIPWCQNSPPNICREKQWYPQCCYILWQLVSLKEGLEIHDVLLGKCQLVRQVENSLRGKFYQTLLQTSKSMLYFTQSLTSLIIIWITNT